MPWLMKAEPDSRLEKGVDVKFSVDDFEKIGITKWDGVRNHEAKVIMKDRMKSGDQVLFYHSNCKVPGVFALAEVCREGYPDFTAWDPKHPYYDPKTDKEKPTWFMVDVKFRSRVKHPVTLALLKHLTSLNELPEEVNYIGDDGLTALKGMALVNRGRLSVQPVSDEAYATILKMGKNGGFENLLPLRSTGSKRKPEAVPESSSSKTKKVQKTDTADTKKSEDPKPAPSKLPKPKPRSSQASKLVPEVESSRRRSSRLAAQ